MDWCERQGIDYVFGLAKNARLLKEIKKELKEAEAESVRTRRDGSNFQESSLSDGPENLEPHTARGRQSGALE